MGLSNSSIKVSAIIPVYNEEKTVAGVIKTLLASKMIDEIIGINDGSTDRSLRILKGFGKKIILIDYKRNRGKGFALAQGIKKAKGEIVAFFDADLVNLSEVHIEKLVSPLLKKEARVALGYRRFIRFLPCFFSPLTGERAYFRQDLLRHVVSMEKTRFGVEVFLNNLFKRKKRRKVALEGLMGLYKYEKHPSVAVREIINEGLEIAKEVTRQEKLSLADAKIINQLKKMKDLKHWEEKVKKIKNKKVRVFLQRYILKYLKRGIF